MWFYTNQHFIIKIGLNTNNTVDSNRKVYHYNN